MYWYSSVLIFCNLIHRATNILSRCSEVRHLTIPLKKKKTSLSVIMYCFAPLTWKSWWTSPETWWWETRETSPFTGYLYHPGCSVPSFRPLSGPQSEGPEFTPQFDWKPFCAFPSLLAIGFQSSLTVGTVWLPEESDSNQFQFEIVQEVHHDTR